ncbi:hypothetical protein AMS68_002066 [Peltaster fructicola]|uniref:histidine kinase n=1 Tax=Peltaster fructicola TaxID=286661 RepID=A0A6H0XPJ9_9PEZI|nr:hypothetical protein AMS68_002066 [Peltaster fructicola]
MPPQKPGQLPMIASIIEATSATHVADLEYLASCKTVPLLDLLDFAIGACAALEIVHHSYGLMHGELRNDAFHFDRTTRAVRLLNFDFGARNFVNSFTNAGWSHLLTEAGVSYKLQFFAPEQTGRLPVDPDMRTDIYSLGLGLWSLATGRHPFAGLGPLETIQAVLSQPLPPIETESSIMQAVLQVVAKMTRKAMHERYNSVSGAKKDLEQIRRLFIAGLDVESFEAGQDDISPVFKLATRLIGRTSEQKKILEVVNEALSRAASRGPDHDLGSLYRELQTSNSLDACRSEGELLSPSTLEDFTLVEPDGTSFVAISGESGYGKTFLVHSTLSLIRGRMLLATVQLERMKTRPLAPILKLVSSLLKQIFSDADVETDIHTAIRLQLQPHWPTICPHLELPLWLLGTGQARSPNEGSKSPLVEHEPLTATQAQHLSQIIIGNLSVVSRLRAVCLAVDDGDLIDDESLEILQMVVSRSLPLVLIMTHKPGHAVSRHFEDFRPRTTCIELKPFSKRDTEVFVSETIHHPPTSCAPLGSLVYERSAGVPLHIKSFMDKCSVANLIYFCWQDRCWKYKIDRIAEYPPIADGHKTVQATIYQRYLEMPSGVRALLSWAALLESSFAFTLLKRINDDSVQLSLNNVPPHIHDCLESLQQAISKFILLPTNDENLFRFTEGGYRDAALQLNDVYESSAMHYVVATSMIASRYEQDTGARVYQVAEHIMDSLEMIRIHAIRKEAFLRVLTTASSALRDAGAYTRSASYCDGALMLASDEPWTLESFQLYNQTAEIFHLARRPGQALDILDRIERNVPELHLRVSAAVTRSRIHASRGDGSAAYTTLLSIKGQLVSQHIPADLQACKDWLRNGLSRTACSQPFATTLLSETLLASLWMDSLLTFQHAISLVSAWDGSEANPHAITGLTYLCAVALFELKDLDQCLKLRAKVVRIMARSDCTRDVWSRGLVLRAMLVGHLEVGSREQIDDLTQALESSSSHSDKSFRLLNIATLVVLRVCIADDLDSILRFIDQATSDIIDWQNDRNSGIMLVCARQVVRCLRGLTRIDTAQTIMCDADHDSETFALNMQEPCHELLRVLYKGCRVTMLNVYGYHREALELGRTLMPWVNDVRVSLFLNAIFYQTGLAIAAVLRLEPDREDREQLLGYIRLIRARIALIAKTGIPQCEAWLLALEGEIANDASSLRLLNLAVETIDGRGSPVELGICLELYIKCLTRTGAGIAVQPLVEKCSASYASVGAAAKALQVLRLDGRNLDILPVKAIIIGPQDNSYDAHGPVWQQSRTSASTTQPVELIDDGRSIQSIRPQLSETLGNPLDAQDSQAYKMALGTLDIIDLHSIISASQAMSSELNTERLLRNLAKIIAESTAAMTCSIVTRPDDQDGWFVTAQSDEKLIRLEEWTRPLAKQINVYVLRFCEEVLIHDTGDNETFANSSALQCEKEASVLCVPLMHSNVLLGSVYCQALPHTFTERTMALVRLLVMQLSICLSNALGFKRLEKASADNLAMLKIQQTATDHARVAELKAVDNLRQKEEAMKAKELFLANISHELRTPLNGVIGLADILKDTKLTSHQSDCARSIGVCADTLLAVINDILDFSKLEAGKMQCENQPIRLSQRINDIMNALRATRSRPGVETIDDIQLDPDLIVLGDMSRLQQVIMNLMSNAYKFTAKGFVKVAVKVESRSSHRLTVMISVADSGIGISAGVQQKLFLPFTQADSTTQRLYGGTGLGLSICKAIIEDVMSGRIWLESAVGKGTTVSFVVPFDIVDNDAHAAVCRSPDVVRPAGKRLKSRQLKICIAEDNAVNRKIATTYVKKLGYMAEAFENGRLAVNAVVEGEFDAILMDVQMPTLDGYGATKEIRQHETPRIRDIVIIALTASTIQGDREKCIEAGMDGYVVSILLRTMWYANGSKTKPMRLQTLKEAIAEFLEE